MNPSFFRQNRIGRSKYFLSLLIFGIVVFSLTQLPVTNLTPLRIRYIVGFIAFGSPMLFYILFLILTIKRFHDMNLSGWYILILLFSILLIAPVFYAGAPLIAMLIAIPLLSIKKGTAGPNRFGEDPITPRRT
ncbi:MAG: DUF805 domain-containing protein [bacterium]|nr:DUF805 domain-containing protein [bacterium]